MFEDEELDHEVQPEDAPTGCMISEIQDPDIDDGVALQLAMLHSREEATAAASKANPSTNTATASQMGRTCDSCSETSESWDLCETSSISSSWLDVDHEHATEHMIEEEDDDLVILKHSALEMPSKESTPPSFAEVLARKIGSSPAPVFQFHDQVVKPHWVFPRVLKPVPEHEADETPGAIEDWEMYKSSRYNSSNLQNWRHKRRARRK